MTGVFKKKRRNTDTDRHAQSEDNVKIDTQRERYVRMEAGVGVRFLQVKECQGLWATPEAKRKVWNISF